MPSAYPGYRPSAGQLAAAMGVPIGAVANPRVPARQALRAMLEEAVPKLGAKALERVDAGSDQVIIRLLDELLGRPTQAVAVTVEPGAVYRELTESLLARMATAGLLPDGAVVDAEIRELPSEPVP